MASYNGKVSINEKYKGDALLQKRYGGFLTKTTKSTR